MKNRLQQRRSDQGFALIGVLVLVAVLAILSIGVGALYLRQLDQQRQVQTQQALEKAFHGLFPGNQKPGASLWKDFGFVPDLPAVPPGNYDLGCMTSPAQVGAVEASKAGVVAYAGVPNPAAGGSLGAWNGPYWQGSVDAQNRPVDAWGRPLQLRYISSSVPPGWQVYSSGANGANETGNVATPVNDDLVYPQPPYVIPPPKGSSPTCATPTVPFLRTSGFNPAENISITLTWPGGSQVRVVAINNGHPDGNPPPVFANLPQGPTITVSLMSDRRGDLGTRIITIDPGCKATPSPITF